MLNRLTTLRRSAILGMQMILPIASPPSWIGSQTRSSIAFYAPSFAHQRSPVGGDSVRDGEPYPVCRYHGVRIGVRDRCVRGSCTTRSCFSTVARAFTAPLLVSRKANGACEV